MTKNHTVNVDCRANTGPVEKLTPVLFVPETLAEWPDGLEVTETLLNITRKYVTSESSSI